MPEAVKDAKKGNRGGKEGGKEGRRERHRSGPRTFGLTEGAPGHGQWKHGGGEQGTGGEGGSPWDVPA